MPAVHRTQHLPHGRFGQRSCAKRNRLIRQRQRIAHRTARRTRQQAKRARFGSDAFVLQHTGQMRLHRLRRHRPQVELQAARQHGRRHLLRVRRGEHEFQVLGRLFQRLQHRVEGRRGEHVNFVDHVDLEAPHHRLVDRLIEQRRDLFDTAIGGCVELHIVDEAPAVDVTTRMAHTARMRRDAALPVRPHAVERFGQQPRHRRLAHAARSGEQVGMVQAPLRERIRERLHDVLLPHQLLEVEWPVFAREDDVAHPDHSTGAGVVAWGSGQCARPNPGLLRNLTL